MQRRRFLQLLLAVPVTAFALVPRRGAAADESAAADPEGLLEDSQFAYISPLRADGSESTCHAELWYAWLDGSVVAIVGAKGWKARAIGRGLRRARIWIGDHGRWRGLLGKNEDFREAHPFDAEASVVKDEALLERLIAVYERKYPGEIAEWRDRFRSGFRDGSRLLLRYQRQSG